jgi:ferredoxin
LKHRILAIAEEEGVEQASYALKLLQSEGQLNIASTGKDPGTGRMETQEYHVEGPVMLFLTTTSDDTDPELENRCIKLSVCEQSCQTEAIHRQQRKGRTLDGRQREADRRAIRELHQNAQRLLQPLEVVNNYAEQLTFRSDQTKSRRAHDHYLTLIEAVTYLHQYQRPTGTFTVGEQTVRFVETTPRDIEIAGQLANRFLGRSFAELPERTQLLLEQIVAGARGECERQGIELCELRFGRREVRPWSTFGHTQLKAHLARLVEFEYLKIHSGGGKGRPIVYELAYDPAEDLAETECGSGLLPAETLRRNTRPDQVGREVGPKNAEVAPNDSPEDETGQGDTSRRAESSPDEQADAA